MLSDDPETVYFTLKERLEDEDKWVNVKRNLVLVK